MEAGGAVADVTATLVEVCWLLLVLVGGRNSKTKAATIPKPAITASAFFRQDHGVRPDVSSGSGGGGASAEGGGPYRGIRRARSRT
ncbi:MAG: hypothetical protein JO085_13785 [Acidimicrobiia bacterium]|nr:hypothetical protein [Acidimicrobiia bacterium]